MTENGNMAFGKVVRKTWRKENFRELSILQKFILFYLWTHPDAKNPGLIRYSYDEMSNDLCIKRRAINRVLRPLVAKNWFYIDYKLCYIYFPKWHIFSPPRNPSVLINHLRDAERFFDCELKRLFINDIRRLASQFQTGDNVVALCQKIMPIDNAGTYIEREREREREIKEGHNVQKKEEVKTLKKPTSGDHHPKCPNLVWNLDHWVDLYDPNVSDRTKARVLLAGPESIEYSVQCGRIGSNEKLSSRQKKKAEEELTDKFYAVGLERLAEWLNANPPPKGPGDRCPNNATTDAKTKDN